MTDTSMESLPFSYTNRDWDSIRQDMFRRMRIAIPDWVQNNSSMETVLMDIFAWGLDGLHYYVDRMGAEAYIQTAVMRESVLNLAYMFGYTPTQQTAARGAVTFTKNTAAIVVVPMGTKLYAASPSGAAIVFETEADHEIDGAAGATEDIVVVEGTSVLLEAVGTSTGGENQTYPLYHPNVIDDSVRFYTRDGAVDPVTGQSQLVEWQRIPRIIDADAPDRVFVTYVDEFGATYIRLGDGVSGAIPTTGAGLYATYRYGVGAAGNVGPGTVTGLVEGGSLAAQITSVFNPGALIGGADAETIASMRRNIVRSLTALERAVTAEDYATLCLDVGGIVKASAISTYAAAVTVYVSTLGDQGLNPTLTSQLQTYLDKRKMIGTTVTIAEPVDVDINIAATVAVAPQYRRNEVKQAVEDAIAALYAFDNVEIGGTSQAAVIFRTIYAVNGVETIDLTVHSRTVGYNSNVTTTKGELMRLGTLTITATGGVTPL